MMPEENASLPNTS